MKKIILLIVAILLNTAISFAQGGTTGPLTWDYNSVNNTLTITGSGAMPNYPSIDYVPWYSYKNGIITVALGSGVTHIGQYAFHNFTNLNTIDLSNVTSIGSQAFSSCTSLSSIDIASVTLISSYAFRYCSGINTITIPNGVTSIGVLAFGGCNNLATVNFNATNCTVMGGYSDYPVFQNCNALQRINVGDNVTSTPAHSFRGCTQLQHLYSYCIIPPTAVNNSTFYGINKNTCILHVPVGTIGAYSIANGWKEFLNIVEILPTHTISGQVTFNSNPLSGVTIAYTGGSTTTNSSGQYIITVEAGTTVTITPSLTGYTFTPPSITCNNVTSNLTNQNFTAQVTFVPVTNITGVPTTATATLPLTLTGAVVPSNATNQTITWSLVNAGTTGATIADGNILNTTNSGTAIVEAKVINGISPTANYTQNCTITVSKAILGGAVSVTGNAVFGQTLTAVPSLTSSPTISNLGALSYQWRRGTTNISGATNSTYTLVQADIGNVINVVVTAANCSGTVTSANTATVTKATQTAPAAPTLNSRTSTSITLHTVTGCEYNINGGAYQSSSTFGGLSPSTSYTFTQRKAETLTHLASPASPPATFNTEEGTPPVLGGTVVITGNAVFGQTLTAISNLTSTPPGNLGEIVYQWKSAGTPVGTNASTYILLETDISHTMTVTVTASNCTGSVTSNPTAVVTKATQTAPTAPTLNNSAPTSITLNIVSGCEYNINGGAWQTSPTFVGLTPNTSYAFTQRKAETATHFASPSSAPANFITDNTTVPLYTIVSYVNNPAFGTITPYGENIVEEGKSIEFTIEANIGYIIESVMINGTNHGAIYSYTFENVQENGTIAVVFVKDVGIDENTLAKISVYPNPTTGELRIENYELRIERVEIFDIYGRKHECTNARKHEKENLIDISKLPSGIYFLRIMTEQGEVVRKVLKE
jgi:hypothetical protein